MGSQQKKRAMKYLLLVLVCFAVFGCIASLRPGMCAMDRRCKWLRGVCSTTSPGQDWIRTFQCKSGDKRCYCWIRSMDINPRLEADSPPPPTPVTFGTDIVGQAFGK